MRRLLPDFALLAVAAAVLALGAFACGRTLGLVFFNLTTVPLLALPLAGRGATLRLLTTTGLCAIVAGGIVAGLIRIDHRIHLGVQTAALSAALALATAGGVELFARSPRGVDLGRGVAGLLLVAWLTWPIWMAPHWPTPAVARWLDPLTAYQPLLAINGAALDLGVWSHQPIAYRYLLNLGQDVPYALPPSAWRATGAHGVAAVVLIGLPHWSRRLVPPPGTPGRGLGTV